MEVSEIFRTEKKIRRQRQYKSQESLALSSACLHRCCFFCFLFYIREQEGGGGFHFTQPIV